MWCRRWYQYISVLSASGRFWPQSMAWEAEKSEDHCSPSLSPCLAGRPLPEQPNMQNCAAGALIWRGCGLRYRLSADWPHPGGPLRQFYHFRCLGQSWKHYCRKRLLGQQTALVTSRGPCCEDSEGWSPENMGTRGSGGHRTGLFRFTTNKHLPSPVQALPVLIYPPPSHPLTMKWAAVGDQLYALFCQSFSNPLIRSVIHLSVQQAVFWASARISRVKLPCLTEYDYKNGCVIWFDLIYAAHSLPFTSSDWTSVLGPALCEAHVHFTLVHPSSTIHWV